MFSKTKKTKTVIFSIYDGFGARYLLRTDIFKVILHHGHNIIILSPNPEEEYFRKEFGFANVKFEKLDLASIENYFSSSLWLRLFKTIFHFTLSNKINLSTINAFMQEHIQIKYNNDFFKKILLKIILFYTRRSPLLRKTLVEIENCFFNSNIGRDIFEKYNPDLLITTTMGHSIYDAHIMRIAKKFKVKIVTVILSWDNTSKWGIGSVKPDLVLVWSDTIKKELVYGHDIPSQCIKVVGVPHFDIYTKPPKLNREAFLEKFGLSQDRKIILYTTKAPQNFPYDIDIVTIIAKGIIKDLFVFPCQLLVRLHPQHFRSGVGKFPNEVLDQFLNKYKEILNWCPYVSLNFPKILSEKLDMDMPDSEMDDLHAMLTYSDILVNPFSTLNLEGCIHNLPIINIGFDGFGNPLYKHPAYRSISIDENHTHNQRILRLGFTKIARNPEELISYINLYLKSPHLDQEGRRKVVEQECGLLDGQAGKRAAKEILMQLNSKTWWN